MRTYTPPRLALITPIHPTSDVHEEPLSTVGASDAPSLAPADLLDMIRYTEEEAMKRAKCGRTTLWLARKNGELDFIPKGRGVVYTESAIQAWEAKRRKAALLKDDEVAR